tara:strand:- start:1137 stop:2888 length:1752 start_codon:yes stop_codon:yes gene_type:complete
MSGLPFYLRELRAFAGSRLWIALALVGAAALLEGLGFLAFVPLFRILLSKPEQGAAATALGWLEQIGLATPLSQALALAALFLALIALRSFLQWRRDILMRRLSLEFVDHWRRRTMIAISAAPWQALMGKRRTDIEHAIMVDIGRLSSGTQQTLMGVVQITMIVAQLAAIAVIAPIMLVVALALLLVAGVFIVPVSRLAGMLGRRNSTAGRKVHHVLGNFMAGQKLARLYDAQGRFVEQMDGVMRDARKWQLDFVASQSKVRAAFQCFAALAVVAMLLVGYFAMALDLPRLIVVTLILTRISGPTLSLMQTSQSTANMLAALEALRALTADLDRPASSVAPAAVALPAGRHGPRPVLEAEDLWFAYEADDWILRGASLSVGPREIVALDAPSGSGKTTLLDLLAGLMPPARGTIVAEGRVLREAADWEAWRRSLAYLPQDPFLFDTTIRENLQWCAPAATDAEMMAALEMAGAQGLLARCPQGLDTRVGERGQAFSGGERQRICLARGLIRRHALLILDEATSAIDEDGGSAIFDRLRQWSERPAILLVSHRAETRESADRVVRLEGGRIEPAPEQPGRIAGD